MNLPSVLTWLKEALYKMLNMNDVKATLKTEVAMSPVMAEELRVWAAMYANQSPWLTADVKSLNLAAAISADVGKSVTIEMEVNLTGGSRATYLAEQLKPLLNKIRVYTEMAVAKGGLVFKPYVSGDRILIDVVQADMFYPVSFDSNGTMTACIFADQRVVGGVYYTKLEFHRFVSRVHYITNTAWRSSTRDTLGSQVSLSSVTDWADIVPESQVQNVDQPLFSYFKMPFANNIDTQSPMGVSVYSRAKELIEQADKLWSNLLWEFDSGKRALYTDIFAFGKDKDGKSIIPDKRFYRLLDLQSRVDGKGLFEDWTPTIREQNILNGLNAILRRIEFNCGLSYGVLSNPDAVALTATEIKSAKQRYYATITDIQKALEISIDELLYAMNIWASLTQQVSGSYTASYSFDDSVVTDKEAQFQQDLLVLNRVMSDIEFRMRNYNETEEMAKAKLAMLKPQVSPEDMFNTTQ